jgi:uncharacterized DUF497 family protein
MRFEWDPIKEATNKDKHGISFGTATSLFTSGVDYLEINDDNHSNEESRLIAIGPIGKAVIMVVFTERYEDTIRIISARKATKNEVRLYYKYMEGTP